MAKKRKTSSQQVDMPPSTVIADDQHPTLIRYVNEADDATIDSRELSEKCRDYYDTSGQWTPNEKAKLASQGQAATVINRCKPKVDALMGMERANRTTAKAFPRTPQHTQDATAATEAVRFCLQDNSYERLRSDGWDNLLVEGTGGLDVTVKPVEEGYKVIIRQIMWDRIFYDPHSRRKDFSDARYLGQVVWMDYDEAVAEYPEAKDVLETMISGSQTYDDKPRWMDTSRRRVKIVEIYYRRDDGDWWYACFTRGGYCKEPMKSPYLNEEGETEHCYVYASLFVDREGGRYGSLRQVLDVQDEINKRRSKALHLMSVRQTFGVAGAVADLNKARAELAKPDGHVEFAFGELGKDFGVLPTGDMAQAQFNLLTEAKMEMDLVGANAATQGKDKTVQSGIALRQRALTGQTELAPMFDVLKNLDIRVYRKVWNRIRQYWKGELWLRVTDDENNLKFVGLNKPVTQGEMMLKQAAEQGAPSEILAQLQSRIATDPMMKEVVSRENSIADLDVDIVMDDAPDTVTQEVEDFQAMAEMVKSGFPLPPEAVIMASPLSNKDKIIKMMKEQPQIPPQLQEQMQTLQEQAKQLAEENQKLKNDKTSDMVKIQAQSEAKKAELQLEAEVQAETIRLEREKAEADIALKRLQADADFDIENRKMAQENENAKSKLEFERQCRLEDKAAEKTGSDQLEAESLAPKMIESIQVLVRELAQIVANQQQFQSQLVEQLAKPKKVVLGGIQRANGDITGASATIN